MKNKILLIFILFIFFITIYCDRLSINDWGNENTISLPKSWQFIDGGGEYGINKNKYNESNYPVIVVNDSIVYVAWHENSYVRIAKYSNKKWEFIDGNDPDIGLSKNPDNGSSFPDLIIFDSKLYITWVENHQIMAAVLDDKSQWKIIDGKSEYGLNKNISNNACYPHFTEFNSKLYLSWAENSKIRVSQYNGNDQSPEWIFVDGNTDNGLNKDPSQYAGFPHMVSDSNNMFLIWIEGITSKEQVRVAKYNGSEWSFIDGNGEYGINKNINNKVYSYFNSIKITIANSKLYASWCEDNGSFFDIVVAEWDGNESWNFIEDNGLSEYNFNYSNSVNQVDLFGNSNKLYCVWPENGIRIAEYNGQQWKIFKGIDNETGLSYNNDGLNPVMIENQNNIYITWVETSESNYTYQIRAIAYK